MNGDTALLLLFAPILLYAFVRLEQRGRPEVAALALLTLLVVEALIYPSQNEVPGGLFHPNFAGRAFRLPDYLIPLALLARILVRGFPRRMGTTAIAWAAFFAWYGFGTVIGLFFHNSIDHIFFQSKVVLHLGGAAVLVSGVPPHKLANPRTMRLVVLGLGFIVALLAPMALAKKPIALQLPRIPQAVAGLISPDAATILVVVGVIALMIEAARRDRIILVGIAATPLLLSPFIATQRAAILGLASMLVAASLGTLGPTWSRRIRGTPTEGVLLIGILLIPVMVTISMRSIWPPSHNSPVLPFADAVVDTFIAERKTQSADTRLNLWKEGFSQTREYPVMGWGLGKTYEVERAGQANKTLTGGGFHNIAIDLLVRRGGVGLILFVMAIALTLSDAFLVWRRHANRYVATFGFACATALIGLMAKGMVESLFEKFRLATLMGLLIGAIISCASTMRSSTESSSDKDLVLHDQSIHA